MPIRLRRWQRVLIAVGSTYALACIVIHLMQNRLVYYPTRGYPVTPGDVGLEFEDLRLSTADGVRIAAWYVPHPSAAATVIFCHGNAGNISDRLHTLTLLHALEYNTLIFDYRGYGESEGRPTEEGTYLDAESAWTFLTVGRGVPAERIVIVGRSLGGAVAIDLASKHQAAGLVVDSSFTNLVDIGRRLYPYLPVRMILSYRYDSAGKIANVHCPKLFFHGKDDSLIPIENGRALFEAAAQPKEFVETPGDHNEGGFDHSDATVERIDRFIEDATGGTGDPDVDPGRP